MTDSIRPRAKLTHIPLPSPSLNSPTGFPPHVRAKVDPSTLASPPIQSRPTLRPRASTASIRSGTSSFSDIRARSPVPPTSRPSSSHSNDHTPVTRIRASLTPRARSPKTPGLYRNLIGATSEAGSGPSSIRPPLRANLSTEGGRVEMRTLPITPTPLSIQPSPLLLPEIRPSQLQHKDSPKLTPSHDRLPSCSNHSSPGKPTIALPAHLTISLSTISCPSSPLPTHAVRARTLPYNPYSNYPPPLPVPPLSPELRPVALPAMTPRRLSDAEAPEESGAEGNSVVRRRLERDRLSGTTAVNDDQNEYDLSSEMGREVGLEADAEEAKVNRKIADLEISNASLLTINRSLEATKAKQRAEILKLRRALRDSLSGVSLPSTSLLPLNSPITPFSPSIDLDGGEYFDEELADPELEVRWEKITDLVGVMRRRGEEAVLRGREEVRVGTRVLGWTEMQGVEGVSHEGGGGEEGERDVAEG